MVVDIEERRRNAALKAEWQEQILLDRLLTHRAFRVGSFIAWRFDKSLGRTIVGRQTMAEQLGVTDRTVDKGIAELEARGHLSIARGRGRGLANTYLPVLKNPKDRSRLSGAVSANERSPFAVAQNAKDEARKGEYSGEKGRRNVRPLPIDSQIFSQRSPASTRAREAAPQEAWNEGAREQRQRFPFGNRGRYHRELADRLAGDGWTNFQRLGGLTDDRLSEWCRLQRNAPERVDLDALEGELIEIELRASSSGAQ